MGRLLLSLMLLLAMLATPAAGASGVSLRWDRCYSDGGVANKTFACDTNTGSERLVMSFVLDSPMSDVNGLEIRFLLSSVSPTLPDWWQFKNAGSCRQSSLSVNFAAAPGDVNCAIWGENAVGGIGGYQIFAFEAPDSAVVLMAEAVPPTQLVTLAAGQEYVAGSLTINHAKSVGAGACGGCNEPVCLVLNRINITTPVLANNHVLNDPAFAADGDFAHWQGAQETNVQVTCGVNPGCIEHYLCVAASTPTRTSTWGAVKALYR